MKSIESNGRYYLTCTREEEAAYHLQMFKSGLSKLVTFVLYPHENRYQTGHTYTTINHDLHIKIRDELCDGELLPVYMLKTQHDDLMQNLDYVKRIRAGEFKKAEPENKPQRRRKDLL